MFFFLKKKSHFFQRRTFSRGKTWNVFLDLVMTYNSPWKCFFFFFTHRDLLETFFFQQWVVEHLRIKYTKCTKIHWKLPVCVFRSCFQLPGRPSHQGDGRWHPHAICQNPGGQQPAADQRHHLLCQKNPQRLTHTHKHARILFVLFTQTLKTFEPCVNTAKRVLLKRSQINVSNQMLEK